MGKRKSFTSVFGVEEARVIQRFAWRFDRTLVDPGSIRILFVTADLDSVPDARTRA